MRELLAEQGSKLKVEHFKPAGTHTGFKSVWGVTYESPTGEPVHSRPQTSVDKHDRMRGKVEIPDDATYSHLMDMSKSILKLGSIAEADVSAHHKHALLATTHGQSVLSIDVLAVCSSSSAGR